MNQSGQPWRCYEDLFGFVESLKGASELIEIHEAVDPRFEVAAVLGALGEQGGPAALFTNVIGFPEKMIVGNIFGNRTRVAKALGVSEKELTQTYIERKQQHVSPVSVKTAAVKEVAFRRNHVDLFGQVPALVHHERDASPYLTCAVTFSKDPETGRQSMGLHRIQVQSNRTLGICLETPPLARFLQKALTMKKPLEVAVIIGPDPAVLIASVIWCPEGDDKIEIAGGLRQKPVEMVRCETVELQVPAHAQYLIEGIIQPEALNHEGLFGDSSGIYVEAESPVIDVTSVCHRKRPLYQALQTWSSEDDALFNLCFGSDLLGAMQKSFPFVRDFHLITGTVCGHAVMSVAECPKPLLRSAMVALLIHNPFVKRVVFVNEDIDIRNPREVEWALATRFQPDQDLLLIPEVYGSVIDPSASPDRGTCKMGMDATFPKERVAAFQKIDIPKESRKRAAEILRKIGNYD